MTVSSLASKCMHAASSNYTSGRSGKSICKITPHHAAGVLTAEAIAKIFQASGRGASANYCIGNDGDTVCSVEEENRSWCSSSASNDNQAITIEISNSSVGGNYPISDAAWNALVNLCVDICTRYDFTLEYTGDSSGSLTEHRMFKATACPGEYLHSRMSQLASEVNARLKAEETLTVPDGITLTEYAGANRYETASLIVAKEVALAKAAGTTPGGVIVASGETDRFPDALAASGLSGLLGYPIVLTDGESLSSHAKTALSAVGSNLDIIVVGGTSAISQSVRTALKSYGTLTELYGESRYETAQAVYDYGAKIGWNTEYTIVATGANFPDALSIGSYAAWAKARVVLVNGSASALDDVAKAEIANDASTKVVILGGTTSVSQGIESDIAAIVGTSNVTRLGGSDRYETSALVASWALGQGMTLEGVGFATGANPADALAASPLLGMTGSVMLLVGSGANTKAIEVASSGNVSEVSIFGGNSSVSIATRNRILAALV